jgi:malate synthase
MDKAFLNAYVQLLVKTCHRRGVHAMGGMAAQIPIKDDPTRNDEALAKVRADKLREVTNGHDGTWVAHPGLVAVAREVFDAHMTGANQLHVKRDDVTARASDLLEVTPGTRSMAGLRHNVRVGVQYLESWLRGVGCVPIYSLMEDAATAEISRAQVWQWIKHQAKLDDGSTVSPDRFLAVVGEEMARIQGEVGDQRFTLGKFPEARALFERLSLAPTFEEFLTLPAYELVTAR